MGKASAAAERMCVVTRDVLPKEEMIRFVLDPEVRVTPDLKCNLPGRGVWVRADREVLDLAVRKRQFARGFKTECQVDPDLTDLVARLLRQQALGRLGLIRKAGQLALGFGKVEKAISRQRLAAVIHASDAADDGVRKLEQAFKRRYAGEIPCPVIRVFSSEELGAALGGGNVIHGALLDEPICGSFLAAYRLLARLEGVNEGLSLPAEMPDTTTDMDAE